MTEHLPITPGKLIEQLGITPITLRRWCAYHRVYLSPGANPGEGVTRRFTGRDLEVLRHVRSLRDQGLTTEQINEQLAGLTFPEIEEPDALTVPPASQEGPGAAQLPALVSNDLTPILERLGRLEQGARPNWWWWVFGVVCGLAMAGLAELAALVASRH